MLVRCESSRSRAAGVKWLVPKAAVTACNILSWPLGTLRSSPLCKEVIRALSITFEGAGRAHIETVFWRLSQPSQFEHGVRSQAWRCFGGQAWK